MYPKDTRSGISKALSVGVPLRAGLRAFRKGRRSGCEPNLALERCAVLSFGGRSLDVSRLPAIQPIPPSFQLGLFQREASAGKDSAR